MRALLLGGGLALWALGSAGAQQRPALTLRGDALVAWVHADTGALRSALRGPALGAEGRVTVDTWLVGVGLLEGRLRDPVGSAATRDWVQATVFAGARPLPWLEVTAGPVIRAFVSDTSTERWVFWQARARVDVPIVLGSLSSYVELWRAVSSQVNLATAPTRVQGGEAGVVYQVPERPYWVRLAYRMDDAQLAGPGGSETLETLAFSVGLQLR